MTSSDDWIAAFGSTFTGGSLAAASATSGLTVISSGSSQPSLSSSRSVSLVSSGEYGGVAKRAHLGYFWHFKEQGCSGDSQTSQVSVTLN
jgi:hypothetical protein